MIRPRGHAPIPSGRRGDGGLTKDQVTEIQRTRILFAMVEAVADQGYTTVSVSDVVARAGVSRATFYELFADKQDCFLAAFDTAVDIVLGGLEINRGVQGSLPGAVTELLSAYLAAIADNPAFSRVFLIDIYAVPDGSRRRAASQAAFAALLAGLFDVTDEKGRFACEAIVAAISTLVTSRLAVGDLDGIRALHGPLVRFVEDVLAP